MGRTTAPLTGPPTARPVTARRGRRWLAALATVLLVGAGLATPITAGAAPATGTLTVMLLSTNGKKLPLARIVVDVTGPATAGMSLRTDASGQAVFDGLPEASTYTVRVSQRGDQGDWTRLPASKENVSVVAGHHLWVAVTMRLAGSIGGRIVNQSGVPVVGYTVRAVGRSTGWSEQDVTDFDGYYVVRSLATDTYRVDVSGPGTSSLIIRREVPVVAQHGSVPQTFVDFINGIVQQPYPVVP